MALCMHCWGASVVSSSAVSCRRSEPAGAPESNMLIPVERQLPPTSSSEDTPQGSDGPQAKAPVQSSPAPELPSDLPVSFSRQQHCAQLNCVLDQWLPDPAYALSTYEQLPARAALWIHELDQGANLSLPPHPTLELLAVPLKGALRFRGAGHTEHVEQKELGEWVALRAPGAGVALSCKTRRCRVLLALIATQGALDAALVAPARWLGAGGKRPGSLETRAFESAPTYTWNAGKNHARIVFGGTLPFSLTLLSADPDVSIPPHSHEPEWENLLVLRGRGEFEMRGRPYPLAGGEVVHIAAGVRHGYRASGTEPLAALQIYTPAGPEQRFIEATGRRAAPLSGPPQAPNATVAE